MTGFADGEGCFIIRIRKDSEYKSGWRVNAAFQIALHEKDRALLEKIKAYFQVGAINKHGDNSVQLQVASLGHLTQVVIPAFNKYPLISQKRADFELFKLVVELMNKKQQFTMEGLNKIVAIKASMNNGLSPELQAEFPNVIPVKRPLVLRQEIIDPHWLAGFTEGDGCFSIITRESSSCKLGTQVELRFRISQDTRDAELMRSLVSYLGCGKYPIVPNKQVESFSVSRFRDITDKIIPFFDKYQLHGVKALDFADFRKVAEIMKVKGHLTKKGLEEICKIEAGINRGRPH